VALLAVDAEVEIVAEEQKLVWECSALLWSLQRWKRESC